jgi:hypothetical protein
VRIVALGLLLAACPAPKPPVIAGDHHVVHKHNAAITLTWVVHPPVPDPKDPDNLPLYPLDLVVGSERITLKPQLGSLKPYYQSACPNVTSYSLEEGEVAKIAFTEGGAGGYVVRRTPKGLALFEWADSHNTCTDPETGYAMQCPDTHQETEVRVLPAPLNVELLQKLVIVDAAGKQTPYDCSLD